VRFSARREIERRDGTSLPREDEPKQGELL